MALCNEPMVLSQRSSKPSLRTNVATSSSPALATRFGSSKVTAIRSIHARLASRKCLLDVGETMTCKHRHFPTWGGIFADVWTVNQLGGSGVKRNADSA